MRTTIEIDEPLIREAMRLTQAKTRREVVRMSLDYLVRAKRREDLKEKLGKFPLRLTAEELRRMRETE